MPLPIFLSRGLIIALVFSIGPASAQVTLPAIFSDNMVLQSGIPVTIWGHAGAGEAITISFGKQRKQIKANDAGDWQVILASWPPLIKKIFPLLLSEQIHLINKNLL